jgi:hypothetical protein
VEDEKRMGRHWDPVEHAVAMVCGMQRCAMPWERARKRRREAKREREQGQRVHSDPVVRHTPDHTAPFIAQQTVDLVHVPRVAPRAEKSVPPQQKGRVALPAFRLSLPANTPSSFNLMTFRPLTLGPFKPS